MDTIETLLSTDQLSQSLKIMVSNQLENRPTVEAAQAAFLEYLSLINHAGILTTVTGLVALGEPSDLLALFLIGFLKGVYCQQAEHTVPSVNPSNLLEAWKDVQELSKFISL